jgi:hypothetical protein
MSVNQTSLTDSKAQSEVPGAVSQGNTAGVSGVVRVDDRAVDLAGDPDGPDAKPPAAAVTRSP